jgi:phosphohistidine swiveling domain-containing protein
MKPNVLPLSDLQADLATVGGKGMSLAKLARAGLPVPDGYHVTTEAYRQFIAANNLQTKILAALTDVDVSLPKTLETASASISRFFAESKIPTDIANTITDAYATLPHPTPSPSGRGARGEGIPVAVRSSATAEDLPEASFAGQQETFLNILGKDALLDAVKKCWASLWTARAIAYRAKQNIDPDSVALAVVVQEMVDAEAAGILFTANPINGRRDEMVINAAWGLGEAIVGGHVSPDTIVADKATGKVKQYDVAEKTVITVITEKGTREDPLDETRRRSKVMNEAQVVELVNIARRIESYYGSPQDIEWCLAASPSPLGRGATGEGKFQIVQSRPITALPESPIEWIPPKPKGVYMRASVVDLMPGPLSPLFVTTGIPALMAQMQPLGRRLTGADPVLHEDYYTSINNFAYMNAAFPAKSWWWILTSLVPMFVKTFGKLGLFWRDQLHPEYQAFVASRKDILPEQMSVSELWREAQEYVNASAGYVCGLLFATMGASSGAELLATNAYNKMAKRGGDPDASALLMGWDNIPVRAEKSLYDLAMWARERVELAAYVLATPSGQLAEQLRNGQVPVNIRAEDWMGMCERFNEHLQKFGHIIFQLDFAEPLPLDNPAPMLENIKMYLRGEGTNPHERQKTSEQKRVQTGETMLCRLRGFKRWAFTKALNYGQSMAAVREDALAEIGLGYPVLRRILHELGNRFVEAGIIEQASDIYLLEKKEIEALAGGAQLRLTGFVAERKACWDRLRKETPPPMMPMKKKYMGIDTSVWLAESESNRTGNIIKGVPTSVGKVTAPARVLRGPEDFEHMRPGEVLVAGTTTPAWTPLFAMASAIVTDIGGPLSHGSIVAREYGIPAVMGTGVATKRIQSGQVITVDGSAGTVTLTN